MAETGISSADASRIIAASYAAIPSPQTLDALLSDAANAEARGYYDPAEDERLRETYAQFLAMRAAIWQMIWALKPRFQTPSRREAILPEPQAAAFGLAFCGAEILVGTGEYLIELARKRPIIRKKLDEAEPRFGIERKSFTRLFRGLTSLRRMRWFYQSRDYFDTQRGHILKALHTEDFGDIADILTALNLPSADRGDHLKRYMRFVKFSARRRRSSAKQKILFSLFEETGSDIAELKIPLIKPRGASKRVTPDVAAQMRPLLRPGDVFVTRHDDALSNLFLPGFWPHAALYIGTSDSRSALGLTPLERDAEAAIEFLESKKDGVLLRPAADTLAVDACIVLRPKLTDTDQRAALSRALSHAGKLYDFSFDFTSAARLACTELIYRTYHGIGDIDFQLSSRAGRLCLSAEDLINQALRESAFELVLAYGIRGQGLLTGAAARDALVQSFDADFD